MARVYNTAKKSLVQISFNIQAGHNLIHWQADLSNKPGRLCRGCLVKYIWALNLRENQPVQKAILLKENNPHRRPDFRIPTLWTHKQNLKIDISVAMWGLPLGMPWGLLWELGGHPKPNSARPFLCKSKDSIRQILESGLNFFLKSYFWDFPSECNVSFGNHHPR